MGIQEIVKESGLSLDDLYKNGQRITGLETHYADLDAKTSGFQPSDLSSSPPALPWAKPRSP